MVAINKKLVGFLALGAAVVTPVAANAQMTPSQAAAAAAAEARAAAAADARAEQQQTQLQTQAQEQKTEVNVATPVAVQTGDVATGSQNVQVKTPRQRLITGTVGVDLTQLPYLFSAQQQGMGLGCHDGKAAVVSFGDAPLAAASAEINMAKVNGGAVAKLERERAMRQARAALKTAKKSGDESARDEAEMALAVAKDMKYGGCAVLQDPNFTGQPVAAPVQAAAPVTYNYTYVTNEAAKAVKPTPVLRATAKPRKPAPRRAAPKKTPDCICK